MVFRVLLFLLAHISIVLSTASLADQQPFIMSGDQPDFMHNSEVAPTLFDLLMLQRSSSIFFDYLRESKSISGRVSDVDTKSTLLLPTNRAVVALGWKPHRGPPTSDTIVEISEKKGHENVERWISAHLLPVSR